MKKYILIATAALLSLASCSKDFLNKAPKTAQSDELTLSTIEGVDQSVGGTYSPLASNYWYGAEFIIRNEMKTSNGKKSLTKDSGRLVDDYQINYSDDKTYSGLWSYAYYVIANANVIIDKIDATPSLGDAKTLANYKAECLFLRALSYFDLVRCFAQPYIYTADASHLGVPIVLHQDVTEKPKRNTVKEVYKQIITDLTEAEKIIEKDYRRSGTDPASSVSVWAIKALLSRVYLYSQNWQGACDKASEVIDSGKFKMWTVDDILSVKDKTATSCYWADAQTEGEVIFEVYGNKSNSFDGYHDGITPMTTPGGYGDAGVSKDLINLYSEKDIRGEIFIEGKDDTAGDFWTAKYYGKSGSTPDYNNTIVLRLSEMYLNRAEALQNGAKHASATIASDLLAITSNRGADPQTPSITGIYEERQKELAWEGHLWFDLARTGRAMTRTDVLDGVITEVPYPNYRWAMPIPNREISANPNLEQNVWHD